MIDVDFGLDLGFLLRLVSANGWRMGVTPKKIIRVVYYSLYELKNNRE
jgi:hypothetical protein